MRTLGVLRSSRRLGSFPRAHTDEWVLIGQDGGQSIDLGDRTLLVFSDTLILPTSEAASEARPPTEATPRFGAAIHAPTVFRANCAAVIEGDDLRTGLAGLRFLSGRDGLPSEIIRPTDGERRRRLRFWPAHGVASGPRVYLFYLGIETLVPEDPLGFRNVGVGLARLDPASGACERIRIDGEWCLWPPRSDDFHFGVQVLEHDGHLYVFGSTRHGLEVDALVGRVAREEVGDRDAYEFYDPSAGRWHCDPAAAGGLGPCGSDYSVSFNPHLGRFLMLYVDAFAKTLAFRLADRVEGPYGPPTVVGRLRHAPASTLVYLAFEHSKFSRDGGRRVLVSYCEPRFELSSLVEVTFW